LRLVVVFAAAFTGTFATFATFATLATFVVLADFTTPPVFSSIRATASSSVMLSA
jgi:hypothetical protein